MSMFCELRVKAFLWQEWHQAFHLSSISPCHQWSRRENRKDCQERVEENSRNIRNRLAKVLLNYHLALHRMTGVSLLELL